MDTETNYDFPYRKNYEMYLFFLWQSIALISFAYTLLQSDLPDKAYYYFSVFSSFLGLFFFYNGFVIFLKKKRLKGYPISFLDVKSKQYIKETHDTADIWIGYGNVIGQPYSQALYDLLKRDINKIVKKPNVKKGASYIHGILNKEISLRCDLKYLSGGTLIAGATGSGKTRLLDLLINQFINRNECCIIIDPKGDAEIKNLAKRQLEKLNRGDDFLYFHPAHPRDSVRLQPLKNFGRSTEISNRVTSLIDGDGEAFYRDMAFTITQSIVDSMHILNEQVTLVKLKEYFDNYPLLIEKTIKKWLELNDVDWYSAIYTKLEKITEQVDRADLCLAFFAKNEKKCSNLTISSLRDFHTTKARVFSQSTGSLTAALTKLTTGELGEMLSPNDPNDDRPMYELNTVIETGKVLCIGTDSLSDKVSSTAMGRIILAECASIAANRYNYKSSEMDSSPFINVIVDEAAEVLCESLIQLCNKGRGGNFRLIIATQSVSDLVASLGSQAKADQIIASTNNFISTRCFDTATQERVCSGQPTTRIKYVMRTQGFTSGGGSPTTMSGNLGERLMEEEVDLFPMELMAQLPDLEYIAKLADGKLIKGRIPVLTDK